MDVARGVRRGCSVEIKLARKFSAGEHMEGAAFCRQVEDAGALWAVLSKSVAESAGDAARRLGGDPDQMCEALDRHFPQNQLG